MTQFLIFFFLLALKLPQQIPTLNLKLLYHSLDSELTSEVKLLNRVRLFGTPWTVAYWAPPSMGFSRQEYWSGLPFPSPGKLPDPVIEPRSPAL